MCLIYKVGVYADALFLQHKDYNNGSQMLLEAEWDFWGWGAGR